ncbi:MAG: PHP domain-containing protein [Clostridia bacterium]|nr:PHP domain-containing protein [Clostridia bacterium]
MYYYETHCHTAISSICGRMSAEELVDLYVKNGYSGVIVTDHFLNGNCVVRREMPDASYEEKIRRYARAYREVKEAAGDKLTVMFGFEYTYKGTDILVYGWDEEKLVSMPEIMDMPPKEFLKFAKENGAFTVQAHPYRQAGYIDHIRLFPQTEGVEVMNASMPDKTNALAVIYANNFDKLKTSGSDAHATVTPRLGGMAFEEPIHNIEEYIAAVRAGLGKPINRANVLAAKPKEEV